MNLAIFIIFALLCLGGALNLLLQRHPINSALSLIVVMSSLSVLYLLLGAEFLAIAQIIDLPFFLIPGNTYRLSGFQLNGISQAQAFGDEIQAPTNYPLVRLTGSGGDVHYARTHDHSSMGVQTGFSNTVWTWFDVPADMQAGTYRIETVANGVPSNHTCIRVLSADAIFADPFELCAPL